MILKLPHKTQNHLQLINLFRSHITTIYEFHVNFIADKFNRFDKTPACPELTDRQTDRRTELQ